jgi:hypothetical protein
MAALGRAEESSESNPDLVLLVTLYAGPRATSPLRQPPDAPLRAPG